MLKLLQFILVAFGLEARAQEDIIQAMKLDKLDYHETTDSSLSLCKEGPVVLIGADTLKVKLNSRNTIESISLNRLIVDSIFPGNTKFDFDFGDLILETSKLKWFNLTNEIFYLLPVSLKNCNGSFCQVLMFFLLETNSKSTLNAYFFMNQGIPSGFYFGVNKEKRLVYVDQNSFYWNEGLGEKYHIKNCTNCYELHQLVYQNYSWVAKDDICKVITYGEEVHKFKIIR